MNPTEEGGSRSGRPHWLQDRRTLLTTVAVAAAYYATGRLGLYFAIPPGYATAIWPPSGIALATALLYGSKIWPGIWLGSFLINVGAGLDFSSSGAFVESLAIPAVIAGGAALQAVVGAWLVKRFLGFPNDFSETSQVARFLAFGG